MSTNPVYAFEHAPSGTLLRAHHDGQRLQLLRRDDQGRYQPLATASSHPNYAVTQADGRVLFHHGHGVRVLDLGADDPLASAVDVSRKLRFLLDADHGLVHTPARYPYEAPDGTEHHGLVVVRLADGSVVDHWTHLDAELHTLELFPAKRPRPPQGDFWDDSFELVRSGDRWALVAPQRVALGEGTTTLRRLRWEGDAIYPPKAAFDDARGRLLLAGRPGVAALDLEGRVVASWAGVLPDAPRDYRGRPVVAEVLSPPLVEGDEVLVVVVEPTTDILAHGAPRGTRAIRLRADDLTYLGDHPIGRLRDPGDQAALLRLADGSLAWFPRTLPLRILPAPDARLRTSDVVHVLGDDPPPMFPEPTFEGYEPGIGREGQLAQADLLDAPEGARRSLARFLLEQAARDPRLRELLLTDPFAFAPYASRVVRLDDAPLSALRDADPRMIAWTAWGADDDAVDELVARIRADLGSGRALPPLTAHRVRMLAHVHTPRALDHAASLGREDPRIRRVLRDELVDVPTEGPARVRYALDARDLYALPAARVEAPTTPSGGLHAGATFGRGKRCAAPLVEVLRVDDSHRPGGWVFFASRCQACDEALEERYDLDAAMRLDDLEEPSCPGATEPFDAPIHLSLGPYRARPGAERHAGRLGGRPLWWQSPEPADCRACGALMFYVGCVFAASIRDDVADLALYAFHCEACATRAQITQMT